MADLPRWQCHKIVEAFKIRRVLYLDDNVTVVLLGTNGEEGDVGAEYEGKHTPVAGGYYVRYDDGYQSFSPAAAFEAGYTPLTPVVAAPDYPSSSEVTDGNCP